MKTNLVEDLILAEMLRRIAAYLQRSDMPTLQGQVHARELQSIIREIDRAIEDFGRGGK